MLAEFRVRRNGLTTVWTDPFERLAAVFAKARIRGIFK
jgi:hypothetical protein